jgi:hypothetical protein
MWNGLQSAGNMWSGTQSFKDGLCGSPKYEADGECTDRIFEVVAAYQGDAQRV